MKTNLLETAKQYWCSDDTNIFNNCWDAFGGFFILLVFPAVSLCSVICCDAVNWMNYAFPIFTISGAGIYDAYGKYTKARGFKLNIRIVSDIAAIIFALSFRNEPKSWGTFLPFIFLIPCGIGILYEVCNRFSIAIRISPWFVPK